MQGNALLPESPLRVVAISPEDNTRTARSCSCSPFGLLEEEWQTRTLRWGSMRDFRGEDCQTVRFGRSSARSALTSAQPTRSNNAKNENVEKKNKESKPSDAQPSALPRKREENRSWRSASEIASADIADLHWDSSTRSLNGPITRNAGNRTGLSKSSL